MTTLNWETFFDIWQDKYEDAVDNVFKVVVPFWKKLSGTGRIDETGKKIIFSDELTRNYRGVGPRDASDDWPDVGELEYGQAYTTIKFLFGKFSMPIVASRSIQKPRALVNAMLRMIASTMEAAMQSLSRQFVGDGTGLVATVTGVTGNVISVTNVHNFRPGMYIWAFVYGGSPAQYTQRSHGASILAFKVTEVDFVGGSIEVEDAGDIATNDEIYMEKSVTLASGALTSKEWNGIQEMISDAGTYQNVDRDTNAWYRSYVNTAGSTRDLTLMLLMTFFGTIEHVLSRPLPDELVCSPGVKRAFVNMLSTNNQTAESVLSTIGNVAALKYVYNGNGVVLWDSIFVPEGTILGIRAKDMAVINAWGPEIEKVGGGSIRLDSQKPAHWGGLTAGGNFGSAKPYNLSKLNMINEA